MRIDPHPDWLVADGLPPEVGGLMTTRAAGVSEGPWAGLNLRPWQLPGAGLDEPAAVRLNQQRLAASLGGAVPVYLEQVHGIGVVRLTAADLPKTDAQAPLRRADASITTERGVACTVLVADCLPVLFAAPQGRAVGAAHAGWRGLAGGVLEATVAALCASAHCEPQQLVAWLGACIGPQHFEVGDDVRQAFGGAATHHFQVKSEHKWLADLPALARQRLALAGVSQVSGGAWCTASDASRFFSFRRDRVTGRHAAIVWIR